MTLFYLTPSQRDELTNLLDECRARGATSSQLAPLLEVLRKPHPEVDYEPPTAMFLD